MSMKIDDVAPLPVIRPASVEELGELVRKTRTAHEGIYPIGGRTTLDVGRPPLKPGVAVETTGLDQLIDYPARDMTVTVQSGITIGRLQAELAREGQCLPIDVAIPDYATVGGAIALNQSGPRRYGYGSLRDYVIGISFVTDDGIEVKAGGRVVKNVAGYDLMKLQIGALGTLGVVTQATLKVKPRPEAAASVVFGCSTEALGTVLDGLHASKSRPVAVEVMTQDAWRLLPQSSPTGLGHPWVVAVGFEEKTTTVRWQRSTLADELRAIGVGNVHEDADPAALWASLTDLQVRPESRFICKASVLPSRLSDFLRHAANSHEGVLIHAHALNGVVWMHTSAAPVSAEGVFIRRCPSELKKSLPIWGAPNGDWELMRHIKRTLDPDNVFNPGRQFGDM